MREKYVCGACAPCVTGDTGAFGVRVSVRTRALARAIIPTHHFKKRGKRVKQAVANKPMREIMPLTAAWIDQLREAFGTESINNSIRLGMQGFPDWFHATEGKHQVGTPFRPVQKSISLSDCVIGGMRANAVKVGRK